jgi:lipoprotein-anchoring transpeptidase ErfK/SrfK
MWVGPVPAAIAAGVLLLASTTADAEDAKAGSASRPEPSVLVVVANPPATDAASVATTQTAPDTTPAVTAQPTASPASLAAPSTAVVAPDAKPKPVAPTLLVKIDLSAQRLTLTYDGGRRESWPISSGREGFATPRGTFRPKWASRMWYSRKYDNAPMPHAVFFNGGVAVHATQSIGMLGRPASHGCVRLAPGNAARFYALVHKHGFARTRIDVIGTPPPSRVARNATQRRASHASRQAAPTTLMTWNAPSYRSATVRQPMPVRRDVVRRSPNGVVYLPPGSPYRGTPSFVMNGVRYVRVR